MKNTKQSASRYDKVLRKVLAYVEKSKKMSHLEKGRVYARVQMALDSVVMKSKVYGLSLNDYAITLAVIDSINEEQQRQFFMSISNNTPKE